jgi:hypothetical protein
MQNNLLPPAHTHHIDKLLVLSVHLPVLLIVLVAQILLIQIHLPLKFAVQPLSSTH